MRSPFSEVLEAALLRNEPKPPYQFDPAADLPMLHESDMNAMAEVMRTFLGGRSGNVFGAGINNHRHLGFFRIIVNGAGPEDDPNRFELFRTDFKNGWFDEVRLRLEDGRDIQIFPRGKTIPLLIHGAYVGVLLLTDADKCDFGGRQFALFMQPKPDFDGEPPYDFFIRALSAPVSEEQKISR